MDSGIGRNEPNRASSATSHAFNSKEANNKTPAPTTMANAYNRFFSRNKMLERQILPVGDETFQMVFRASRSSTKTDVAPIARASKLRTAAIKPAPGL